MTAAERIARALAHPLWRDADDAEVAGYLGVPQVLVRRVRLDRLRRVLGADLLERVSHVAAEIDWPGTPGEMIRHAVEVYRLAALDLDAAERGEDGGRRAA